MYTEITHITKPWPDDPHDRIREVGAMDGGIVRWRCSLDEAVARAERGDTLYYVNRAGAHVLVEVVRSGLLQTPYLRTRPDFTGFNNLLSLPQLPYVSALSMGAPGHHGRGLLGY